MLIQGERVQVRGFGGLGAPEEKGKLYLGRGIATERGFAHEDK